MAVDRTNEEWLQDLSQENTPRQAAALDDLHEYLKRGIYFYLSRERSDLSDRSHDDLMQMAGDFAQDATLRILDNLMTFRGDSRFTTWAMKIGTRTAISELRRARYKDFSLDQLTVNGEFMLGIEQGEPTSKQPVSPEKFTEREDVLQIIGQAIDEALTERQRQAIEAVTLRGISMDVVADQMGTNRNALYKLLHDARKKLKSHLEAQGVPVEYIMNLFES
ncbi:MAG: sigma-70 family RNA polymerase sigma factor [Chloroflexi bacterium]|nr:sigma-70 family RNA polymerase sigma factor [Chloroflexota bacterium]